MFIQAALLVALLMPAADSAVVDMPRRYIDYPAYLDGLKKQDEACEAYIEKEINEHRSASADRSPLNSKVAGRWDSKAVPATYVMYNLEIDIQGKTASGVAIFTFAAGSKNVSEAAISFDEPIFSMSSIKLADVNLGHEAYQVLTNFLLVPERGTAVEEQK